MNQFIPKEILHFIQPPEKTEEIAPEEKKEDEYINQIRLNSLQNSVFFNYILLFFCIVFIHGIPFFHVMIYNLFTIILIYILRFHFLIYKNATNE